MRAYISDKIWVHVKAFSIFFIWGLVVAWVSVWVTKPLPDRVRPLAGIVIFLLGFTALEFQIVGERKDRGACESVSE